MTITSPYQPLDDMSLWWLGQPDTPTLIGRLHFKPSLRGVALRYDAAWLRHGFALSEDLPLRDHIYLPVTKRATPNRPATTITRTWID